MKTANSVVVAIFAAAVILSAATAFSQDWSPLGSGMDNEVNAFAIFDAELIAGGHFTTAGGTQASHIAAWDGSNWSALGSGVDGGILALAVYDGKLVAGGNIISSGNITFWDGSSWANLGSGVDATVEALTIYDGKLIAGGYFSTAGGVSTSYIAAWDGSSWAPLGSGMNGSVYALAVYNNKLVAGGYFTTAGGVSANRIAIWDGSSWAPLGSGMDDKVHSLAVYEDKLIAGGSFTSAGGFVTNYVAAWDGSSWSALGAGMNDIVYPIMVYDSKLIAGGAFTIAGGISANRIAAWDGSSWAPLGLGMNSPVSNLTVYNNRLIAGGPFTEAGDNIVNHIAQLILTGTVTDIDGNSYRTVKIGDQWWMAENLKVTHYRNSEAIPNVTDGGTWAGLTTGAYCDYNNDVNNADTFGRLYNWYAVNDGRNIAPAGWHIPTDAEWQTLIEYLGGDAIAGGKMKETGFAHWSDPNTDATNECGFTALAAGYRSIMGLFYEMGYNASFWSSTEGSSSLAWSRHLYYNSQNCSLDDTAKYYGFSVRCVKDEVPTLTTADVSDVMETTAQCGGAITSDGGAAVIARGVCWSTNPTPTVTDDITNDGTGTGSFTSSITGLTGKTTYYVRAYATNSAGTGYGDEISFITTDSMGTVTDMDGNSYRTVKVGNQWWMAENLKVTHYRNSEAIPNVTDGGTWGGLTTGAYCEYDNDINNVATYGRLYNWFAVADSRNIAPAGWHVPTDEEWKQLEMYLGMSQAEADEIGWRGTDEGGKLKETGTMHWQNPNTGATNESGFTALPGGVRYDNGIFQSMGNYASFWSSADGGGNNALNRHLRFDYSIIYRNNENRVLGFSVRCVKDPIDPNVLCIPPTQSSDSELVVPLRFSCQTPTAALQVGLCWGQSPEFDLADITFEGTAVENWNFKGRSIDNENHNVMIFAAVDQENEYIPTGKDTVLAYLHFINPLNTYDSVCILNPYISTDSLPLIFDTCTINGEGLLFADTTTVPRANKFFPEISFDTGWAFNYPDYLYDPGDANYDGVVNLLDILYLITFRYFETPGPAPLPFFSGDANGDCLVNLLDILYLISYKYDKPPGPAPVCGCAEPLAFAKIGTAIDNYPEAALGGKISAEYINGKTIINLSAADNLKGLELILKTSDEMANISCPIEGLQVYSRPEGDMITLALFDINGQHQIAKGQSILLEVDCEAEIVSAFAGGMNAEPLYLEIAGSPATSPTLPDKFALHQNYPNPFNPVTQINFELPVEAHVTLEIYNIMGQKVAVVANRKFAPGYHTVEWDGSSFASGVYFYSIQAGDAIETRKMMLLK